MNPNSIIIQLGADITQFSRSMRQATSALDQFQQANKATFDAFKKVGTVVTAGGVAIATGLGLAVKQAAEFDTVMRKAGAIAGATAEEFDLMKAAAIRLGADTSKSAGEVAEAMTEMAAKGFTATQVIAAMPGVISASEASGEALALTADTVSSALNIWGLEAGEASRVADILAMSANVSAAGIDDLGYVLKYAGAPAAALGISLEELAAAAGIMSDAGLAGSNSGTSLRASLLALNNPAKQQAKIMEELGFSLTDSQGEAKSLSEIVGDLSESLKNETEAQKVATLGKLVGTEAVSGFLALMKAGPDAINANTAALQNSAGASQEAADKMMAGIGGALEELSGAFESAAILIGDQLIPYVQKFAEKISGLVNKFNEASPAFQKLVVLGTALAAGLMLVVGPILLLIGFVPQILIGYGMVMTVIKGVGVALVAFSTSIKATTIAIIAKITATLSWSAALKVLLGPIGWVIAGIGLLTVGIIAIVKWYKKSTDEAIRLNGVTEDLAESTTALTDSIIDTSDAYKSSQTEINATAQANEQLAAKIEELSAIENKSAAEKAALQSHIESLNGSVDGLNLAYNEETNALSMSSEQLQARLKLMQDQEALQAGQERFLEISKEQAKVDMKLTETNALREEWNQKLEDGSVKAREHKAAIAELDEQEAQLTATTADLAAQQIETEKQVTASVEAVAEATKNSVEEQVDAYESLSDRQKDIVDSLKSTWEDYKNQATDMFDKLSDKSKVSISEMTKNLEENQRVMTDWSKNIATLASRGIDEGLLDTLRSAGPESAGHVKALVNASDAELKKLSDAFANGGDVATKALSNSLGVQTSEVMESVGHLVTQTGDSLAKQIKDADFASIGKAMPEGTAKGVIDGTGDVVKATEDMAKQAEDATRNALEVNSPSKVFVDIGEGIPEGTVVGIENGTPAIIQSTKNLAKVMINPFATTYSDFQKIGKDAASGLNQGLVDGQAEVIATARSIANSAASTMRKALDIHSPSRVFAEIGKFVGDGLAIGIDATKAANEKAITGVAKVISAATRKNAEEIRVISAEAEKKRTEIQTEYATKRAELARKSEQSAQSALKTSKNKKGEIVTTGTQKVHKIHADAAANLAKLNADEAKKLAQINDKAWADIVKKEAAISKERLEAVKTYVADKKSLDELSLVAETEVWRKSLALFKDGTKEKVEVQKGYQAALKAVNDEITRINDEYAGKMMTINDRLRKEEEELTQAYTKSLGDRMSALMSFAGLFDEFDVKVEQSGSQLLANLNAQVDGFKLWQTEIEKLAGKAIDDGLIAELREMGPKALPQLLALNSLTDTQLQQYSALYGEKSKLARQQAEAELVGMKTDTQTRITELRAVANVELETLRAEWTTKIASVTKATDDELKSLKDIGKNAAQGLLNGLASMEPALVSKARSIANAVKAAMAGAFDIHSPSRWMRDFIGVNMMRGWIDGMSSMRSDVLAMSANASGWMTPAVPQIAGYQTPKSGAGVGRSVVSGSNIGSNGASGGITQHIAIHSTTPLSPAEIARKQKQASQQLAMEWGMR